MFLSLFLKDELRDETERATNTNDRPQTSRPDSDHLYNERVNFTEVDSYQPSAIQPNLPKTYPDASIAILISCFVLLFVLNKELSDR